MIMFHIYDILDCINLYNNYFVLIQFDLIFCLWLYVMNEM